MAHFFFKYFRIYNIAKLLLILKTSFCKLNVCLPRILSLTKNKTILNKKHTISRNIILLHNIKLKKKCNETWYNLMMLCVRHGTVFVCHNIVY